MRNLEVSREAISEAWVVGEWEDIRSACWVFREARVRASSELC